MKIFALFCSVLLSTSAFAGSKNPAPSASTAAETVWVQRSDGGVACGDKTAKQELEAGAQELKKAGITVLNSRKQNDGKMRAAVCGIPTGDQNAYQIPKSSLAQATSLGFVLFQ